MKQKSKNKWLGSKLNKRHPQFGIQMIIASSFTMIAFATIVILSLLLYNLFSNRIVLMKTESAEQFLTQTRRTLEDYLRVNRRISDALYYSCIKNLDLSEESLDDSFNLVYESNKDNLVSIALYGIDGKIISSVPLYYNKSPDDIKAQSWFTMATHEMENLHFSLPHVQNITNDSMEGYHWVTSLSRYVEITTDGAPTHGILLIDMKYSGIEQILEKVNSGNTSDYIYLSDEFGNIIYHPKQELINAGLFVEDTINNASNPDGTYEQKIKGEEMIVLTKTVSYTGWKLVHVVSKSGYSLGLNKMRSMVILFIYNEPIK
ncbi:MAG: cache domain-containing protein [Eubacteriales bacterium]|nr:cache domain-containing protein [Eubacteriales bacterium]